MYGSFDRCLVQFSLAGELARLLGFAPPIDIGHFSEPFFEDQRVLFGELFDPLQKLAQGVAHVGATLLVIGGPDDDCLLPTEPGTILAQRGVDNKQPTRPYRRKSVTDQRRRRDSNRRWL